MSELKRFDIVGKYRDEETMYEFRPDGECYDADEADKVIAHHKYKRCFKMARWCISMMVFNSKYGTDKKWLLFKKWHKRWLALAEKFKPNNE